MDIYWNIFTMHGPLNVKFPNNTSKWQMEFNSVFKGLNEWVDVKTINVLVTKFARPTEEDKHLVSHQLSKTEATNSRARIIERTVSVNPAVTEYVIPPSPH
jgi:hypothetical protein